LEELKARGKGDWAKIALAARLRRETTVTVGAIADRLGLGTSKSANKRLPEWMGSEAGPNRLRQNVG